MSAHAREKKGWNKKCPVGSRVYLIYNFVEQFTGEREGSNIIQDYISIRNKLLGKGISLVGFGSIQLRPKFHVIFTFFCFFLGSGPSLNITFWDSHMDRKTHGKTDRHTDKVRARGSQLEFKNNPINNSSTMFTTSTRAHPNRCLSSSNVLCVYMCIHICIHVYKCVYILLFICIVPQCTQSKSTWKKNKSK